MKYKTNSTIQSKLIQIQLLVAGTVLVICALSFLYSDYHLFKNHLVQNLESTARVLGLNLQSTLSFSDNKEAENILKSLKAESQILHAELYDRHGILFAKYSQGDFNSPTKLAMTENETLSVFQKDQLTHHYKILLDNELMGTLVLTSDTAIIKKQAIRYAMIALGVLLAGLFIAYLLAQYTQRQLSKPIISLVGLAKKVSHSGDYTLRMKLEEPLACPNEIVHLSEEFNFMLNQIEQQASAILLANQSLEKKVEERTSELKASMLKQQEIQGMLVQTSKMSALGEMAGGIAHEINNPLATLKILTEQIQMLLEDEVVDKALLNERAETIIQTITRMAKIISGMLSFSRTSENAPVEDFLVKDLIDNTMVFCSEKLKKNSVELRLPVGIDGIRVPCRGNQISQVVLNLLNNANDAISPLMEKWISVEVIPSVDFLDICISNSGPKIPDEVREKIFKPFFTTKPVGKGTGLGLSISQRILSDHGGKLMIDENCPHTKFVIRLPMKVKTVERVAA